MYAAMIIEKLWMFMSSIPSTAKPRRTSSAVMRSRDGVGARVENLFMVR